MADLSKLQTDLDAASEKYRVARVNEDTARRASTEALNAVNKAQKAFDEAVDHSRSTAPSGTDWARQTAGRSADAPA